MASTNGLEQNTREGVEPYFINNDPQLAELFPEELAGWHG